MFVKLLTIVFFSPQSLISTSQILDFAYNGFHPPLTDLSIQGIATVTPNGLLKLTNTTMQKAGHAFYTKPIRFKDSPNDTVSSFSTTFVFGIYSQIPILSGHGLAFVVAPEPSFPFGTSSQFLGLFNISNNGNATNHVFAVEFDTILSTEFDDMNDNHVGIDINSLKSVNSSPAGYWNKKDQFINLTLVDRKRMQVWVDYDGRTHRIDVTMAPLSKDKPRKPLVSAVRDLSSVLLQDMFVGFSSATGSVLTEHYLLGWSFRLNGEAPVLALSKLPKYILGPTRIYKFYKNWMPLISLLLIPSLFIISLVFLMRLRISEYLNICVSYIIYVQGKYRYEIRDHVHMFRFGTLTLGN